VHEKRYSRPVEEEHVKKGISTTIYQEGSAQYGAREYSITMFREDSRSRAKTLGKKGSAAASSSKKALSGDRSPRPRPFAAILLLRRKRGVRKGHGLTPPEHSE